MRAGLASPTAVLSAARSLRLSVQDSLRPAAGEQPHFHRHSASSSELLVCTRTVLVPQRAPVLQAEVYGFGKSEELIGQFSKSNPKKPVVATKFAPLPWRFQAANVEAALRVSAAHCCVLCMVAGSWLPACACCCGCCEPRMQPATTLDGCTPAPL